MAIYSPKKCEFYKKEAQDYLNMTLTDTLNIYYKVDMLNLSLYLVNGKYFFLEFLITVEPPSSRFLKVCRTYGPLIIL